VVVTSKARIKKSQAPYWHRLFPSDGLYPLGDKQRQIVPLTHISSIDPVIKIGSDHKILPAGISCKRTKTATPCPTCYNYIIPQPRASFNGAKGGFVSAQLSG
jgi:hypothetical protein